MKVNKKELVKMLKHFAVPIILGIAFAAVLVYNFYRLLSVGL